jgi:hypothetical protein
MMKAMYVDVKVLRAMLAQAQASRCVRSEVNVRPAGAAGSAAGYREDGYDIDIIVTAAVFADVQSEGRTNSVVPRTYLDGLLHTALLSQLRLSAPRLVLVGCGLKQ